MDRGFFLSPAYALSESPAKHRPIPMKSRPSPSPSPPPEAALSELLRSWEVDGTLPEGFTGEVHRRIRQSRKTRPSDSRSSPFEIFPRFVSLLRRPAFALAYIAAGVLVGALSGSHLGASRASLQNSVAPPDAQVRYIASIDPYRMPPASPPPP